MTALTQRQAALERANTVRTTRAEDKRRIKRGEMPAWLIVCDPVWSSARVFDIAKAKPGIGRQRALTIAKRVGVAPHRRLQDLTPRQRADLMVAL